MKANAQTLTSASHRKATVAQWLQSQNLFLSEILGQRMSNSSALGAILFSVFAFAALLCATDAIGSYGWSAFFLLMAVNCVIGFINEFKKGE